MINKTGVKTDLAKKTLCDLELQVSAATIQKYDALEEIRARGLWRDGYLNWSQYLRERWNKSESWFYQLMASAKVARLVLASHEIVLGNESAAREVRKIIGHQIDDKLLPRVLAKAQMLAGEGAPVLGKHIKAVVSVTCEVLDTGGFVWVEDEQVAYNAAMVGEVAEAVKRQRAYAMRDKPQWSEKREAHSSWFGPQWGIELPEDTMIEYQWRIADGA